MTTVGSLQFKVVELEMTTTVLCSSRFYNFIILSVGFFVDQELEITI